jgi:hypothetical protein
VRTADPGRKGPALCGSAAEVAARIEAMRDALGLDLHLAMFDHGALPEPLLRDSLDRYAADVIPRLHSGRPVEP